MRRSSELSLSSAFRECNSPQARGSLSCPFKRHPLAFQELRADFPVPPPRVLGAPTQGSRCPYPGFPVPLPEELILLEHVWHGLQDHGVEDPEEARDEHEGEGEADNLPGGGGGEGGR